MLKRVSRNGALATLLCAAVGMPAHAGEQTLDFGLSNHVFLAGYGDEFRPDARISGGFLHSNSNDRSSDLFTVGLGVSGELNPQIKPRIGANAFVLDGEHVNGKGLAAEAGVTISVAPRVSLDLSAAYSPDIVTSGDLDHYYDLGARIGYEIIPRSIIYAGYRNSQAARQGRDYEIYQGLLLGFRMSF